MIQRKEYRLFSSGLWQKRSSRLFPRTGEFELTFACPFNCRHCYTKCYDTPRDRARELPTAAVCALLRRIARSGALWLCFSGGDPLARPDFGEIYAYALRRGFITTVFTSGSLVSESIVRLFRRFPPFYVDIGLYAATPQAYARITGAPDSFARVCEGFERLSRAGIRVRAKTLLTRQNYTQLGRMRRLAAQWGCRLYASTVIRARLDGDLTPTRLRLEPAVAARLERAEAMAADCPQGALAVRTAGAMPALFRCGLSERVIRVDPYGRMVVCGWMRRVVADLRTESVSAGLRVLLRLRAQGFSTPSPCRSCTRWDLCSNCPSTALAEAGHQERAVPYFCALAAERE